MKKYQRKKLLLKNQSKKIKDFNINSKIKLTSKNVNLLLEFLSKKGFSPFTRYNRYVIKILYKEYRKNLRLKGSDAFGNQDFLSILLSPKFPWQKVYFALISWKLTYKTLVCQDYKTYHRFSLYNKLKKNYYDNNNSILLNEIQNRKINWKRDKILEENRKEIVQRRIFHKKGSRGAFFVASFKKKLNKYAYKNKSISKMDFLYILKKICSKKKSLNYKSNDELLYLEPSIIDIKNYKEKDIFYEEEDREEFLKKNYRSLLKRQYKKSRFKKTWHEIKNVYPLLIWLRDYNKIAFKKQRKFYNKLKRKFYIMNRNKKNLAKFRKKYNFQRCFDLFFRKREYHVIYNLVFRKTRNNTFITVEDPLFGYIFYSSGGLNFFYTIKKMVAAYSIILGEEIGMSLFERKVLYLNVIFKGKIPISLMRYFLKGLKSKQIKINNVINKTQIAFNGCYRLKKWRK